MDLKFNINYIPGTAAYLQLFVFSLLKWSDCSFRLVANGCLLEEVRLLQELCDKSPRLEFFALPSKKMMSHSETLSYLQTLERSDYFCFMDNDIFATGNFLNQFIPYLGQYAGIFSCPPAWWKDEEQVLPSTFQRMGGRYNRTEDGLCLGGSYFAIFDNKLLTQTLRSTGMGFRRYWWGTIPSQYQRQLADIGLKKERYDGGKMPPLLLLTQGEQLIFRDSPDLKHIGGFASIHIAENDLQLQPNRKKLIINDFKGFIETKLINWQRQGKIKPRLVELAKRGYPAIPIMLTDAEITATQAMRTRKSVTVGYFTQLLHTLFKNQPLPQKPHLADSEIETKIGIITDEIVSLYKEFKDQIVQL